MGKGQSGPPPIDPTVQHGMLENQSALVGLAKEQAAHGTQLFDLTFPGIQTAENFYQRLATGDPEAIRQEISPVARQAAAEGAAAKFRILQDSPAGGERQLAMENVDVARGATVGGTEASAYLGAPNALAQLGGQGVGLSISAAGTGISGYSAGSQTLASLGGMQLQEQQIQAEQKGNILGALGGGLQTATELGLGAAALA